MYLLLQVEQISRLVGRCYLWHTCSGHVTLGLNFMNTRIKKLSVRRGATGCVFDSWSVGRWFGPRCRQAMRGCSSVEEVKCQALVGLVLKTLFAHAVGAWQQVWTTMSRHNYIAEISLNVTWNNNNNSRYPYIKKSSCLIFIHTESMSAFPNMNTIDTISLALTWSSRFRANKKFVLVDWFRKNYAMQKLQDRDSILGHLEL